MGESKCSSDCNCEKDWKNGEVISLLQDMATAIKTGQFLIHRKFLNTKEASAYESGMNDAIRVIDKTSQIIFKG